MEKDDENDKNAERVKTQLKELPVESRLKEISNSLKKEGICTQEQKDGINKLIEQILKLLE